MTNWFASIGQASSGLNAARYGLTVVSQNIANADTEGYTRQISRQGAVDRTAVPSLYAHTTGQDGLDGVTVLRTDRADDPVLDARVRTEHARGASVDTTAADLSGLEQALGEPSDDGMSKRLDDFWKAWGSVANAPEHAGVGAALLGSAKSAAVALNSLSASLSGVASSAAADLDADTASASTAASQLAQLNGQIVVATATGQNANALLDQRDTLLDTLSTAVGAVATIDASGAATVTVGGQTLVSGITATSMSADPSTHQVSVGGVAVALTSGRAAARVTTLTSTVPAYQSRLDAVANALSSAANSIQASGYTAAGASGAPIFTGSGAAGITVAMTDPAGIAASSTPGGNYGNGNAIAASQHGSVAGGPDKLYAALVGDLGVASSAAQQQSATQATVSTNVDALHASVSGVSYDEEVSSMLTYQHAFTASSRVLTTIDQMLDTLINHTGVVGLS